MQYALPLDDGFLRRQCPHCEREFKWYHTEEDTGRPVPEEYFCPYCGDPAALDQWFTYEQIEHINALMQGEAGSLLNDELSKLERRTKGGMVSLKVTHRFDTSTPGMLEEPNDMNAVTSPCHPEEPIKIDEQWSESLHCLVCGERFAVD